MATKRNAVIIEWGGTTFTVEANASCRHCHGRGILGTTADPKEPKRLAICQCAKVKEQAKEPAA